MSLLNRLTAGPPRGPFRPGTFTSDLHAERPAAVLGMALGVAFTACFATGLLSHLVQQGPAWFHWPARPAGLFRITQGVHVFTGLATIPLLLAKLFTVYPKLWRWPPVRNAAQVVERLTLVPLVAGSLLLLMTGVQNIDYWYAWKFTFVPTHYWTAWIVVGALIAHVGAKYPIARRALAKDPTTPRAVRVDRRQFLTAIAAAAGLIVATTAGSAFPPLRRLAVLSPRRQGVGPQGLPVNKSAAGVGVIDLARDPGYRLVVEGRVRRRLELSLDDLRARMDHAAELPIACVEGWSQSAHWRGVRLRDVLDEAGAPAGAEVVLRSLQPRGPSSSARLNAAHARDRDTLLALELNGAPLHLDHGYPVRLITPNQPGVLQTKWLARVVVQ